MRNNNIKKRRSDGLMAKVWVSGKQRRPMRLNQNAYT